MDYYSTPRGYNWNFGNPADDPSAANVNGNPNTGSFPFDQSAMDQSAFEQNPFAAGRLFPQLQPPMMAEEQLMLPDEQCDILQHARDSAIDLSNGWTLQGQIKQEQAEPSRAFSQCFDLHSPVPTPTRSPSTSSLIFSTANSPGGFVPTDLSQINTSAFRSNRASRVQLQHNGFASNDASQPHSPLAMSSGEVAEEGLYLNPRLAQSSGDGWNAQYSSAEALVMPHADANGPKILLMADKSKTRAETQIKMSLIVDPSDADYIRFPRQTLAKPKHFATPEEQAEAESNGRILNMACMLVCATAVRTTEQADAALRRAAGREELRRRDRNIPLSDLDKDDPALPQNGGEVLICDGCKERERKRYDRKKKRNEDEQEWARYENDRIIMINEKEYKKLKPVEPSVATREISERAKQVDFAMRIACYGRHQEEKSPSGFRVVFTFTDASGALVAQHMSETFHITDDHKNREAPEPVVAPLLIPSFPMQNMQFVPALVPVMQEVPLVANTNAPSNFPIASYPYFYPQ